MYAIVTHILTFHPFVPPVIAHVLHTPLPQSRVSVLPRGPERGEVRDDEEHPTTQQQQETKLHILSGGVKTSHVLLANRNTCKSGQ